MITNPNNIKDGKLLTRRLIGIILLLLSLVVFGLWIYETFGTTWFIRSQLNNQIAQTRDVWTSARSSAHNANDNNFVNAGPFNDFDKHNPPIMNINRLEAGEIFGIMTVPAWNDLTDIRGNSIPNEILLKSGSYTTQQNLRQSLIDTGAGIHYRETSNLGQVGNVGFSAHRRSRGDSFLHLPQLNVDDEIIIETENYIFVYRVIGNRIVRPSEGWVLSANPFGNARFLNDDNNYEIDLNNLNGRFITLTTCSTGNGGAFGNSHRFIVWGQLYSWHRK